MYSLTNDFEGRRITDASATNSYDIDGQRVHRGSGQFELDEIIGIAGSWMEIYRLLDSAFGVESASWQRIMDAK